MAFLIADGLVLAVLLIFACIGARRGLILSLCGLLAFVVAFLGASFAARTLSPVVADALEPKFAAAIEEQLNESIRQQAEAGEAGRPLPRRRTPGGGAGRPAGDGLLRDADQHRGQSGGERA